MVRVVPYLLERHVELQTLGTAVERASTGHGSAVLVLGEAGIGKTRLVHAFLAAAATAPTAASPVASHIAGTKPPTKSARDA